MMTTYGHHRERARLCFLVCVSILLGAMRVYGDTLHLNDGSVLLGKVLEDKSGQYILANSYGTFSIKKELVKEVFVSQSYEQDIQVMRKLGKLVDVETVRKEYQAGETIRQQYPGAHKPDAAPGEGSGLWSYGRLSLAGFFLSSSLSQSGSRKMGQLLPVGLGLTLGYDQGFEKSFGKKAPYLPGLRVEIGYSYFSKSLFTDRSLEISGGTLFAGPMWALPSLRNRWGCFVLMLLPGISVLKVVNREVAAEQFIYPFTLALAVGYEYSFRVVAIQLQCRYVYTQDNEVPFHQVVAGLGCAFKLW